MSKFNIGELVYYIGGTDCRNKHLSAQECIVHEINVDDFEFSDSGRDAIAYKVELSDGLCWVEEESLRKKHPPEELSEYSYHDLIEHINSIPNLVKEKVEAS